MPPNRVTEADISIATLRIAANQTNGVASFHRLKKEIPDHLNLSVADRVESETRKGEELWEQIIRNIKSHSDVPGNIICEGRAVRVPRVGYRITDSGRSYLKTPGY